MNLDLVTKSSANLNTFDEHLILSGSEDGAEKSRKFHREFDNFVNISNDITGNIF